MMKELAFFFGDKRCIAVGIVFALLSLNYSVWAGNIERVQRKFHLSDEQLGMQLFGIAIGLLIMNVASGSIINRFGDKRVVILSTVLLSTTTLGIFLSNSPLILFVTLIWLGAVQSLLNISVNTVTNALSADIDRPILSIGHGCWSLGLAFGSLLTALCFRFHLSWHIQLLVVNLLIVVGVVHFLSVKSLLPVDKLVKKEKSFVLPSGVLLILVISGIFFGIAEGTAIDWSVVFLKDRLDAPEHIAVLGFGLFALAAGVCRLFGQALITRIGSKKILVSCALFGAFGYFFTVIFRQPEVGLFGFFLVGIGCSLAFPVLYALAMETPGLTPAVGLATFATFSFMGIMFGPAIVGFVSERTSLYHAFGLISILLLVNTAISGRLSSRPT